MAGASAPAWAAAARVAKPTTTSATRMAIRLGPGDITALAAVSIPRGACRVQAAMERVQVAIERVHAAVERNQALECLQATIERLQPSRAFRQPSRRVVACR